MFRSEIFVLILELIKKSDILISSHGYDELADDNILEEYPEFGKGPCVLLLQTDKAGKAIHTVWGIPKDKESPAVLITAYRPDLDKWSDDYKSYPL